MEYFLTTVKRKKYIFVINVGESDSKYFFYSPHQSQSVIGDDIKHSFLLLTSVARGPVVCDYEDGLL